MRTRFVERLKCLLKIFEARHWVEVSFASEIESTSKHNIESVLDAHRQKQQIKRQRNVSELSLCKCHLPMKTNMNESIVECCGWITYWAEHFLRWNNRTDVLRKHSFRASSLKLDLPSTPSLLKHYSRRSKSIILAQYIPPLSSTHFCLNSIRTKGANNPRSRE